MLQIELGLSEEVIREIRSQMGRLGIRGYQLARAVGVSPARLSQVLTGRVALTLAFGRRLQRALDVLNAEQALAQGPDEL